MSRQSKYIIAMVALSTSLFWVSRLLQADDPISAVKPAATSEVPAAKPAGDPPKPVENAPKTVGPPTVAPPSRERTRTVEAEDLILTLDLRDGTHLVCRVSREAVVAFQAEIGLLGIPLRLIREVDLFEDQKTAKVFFHNGDVLTGSLGDKPLRVKTSFGEVSVPAPVISRLVSVKPPFRPDPRKETPARIQTIDADAVRLTQSDDPEGWRSVPEFLEGARIYSNFKRPTAGIAEFSIERDGIVYLACHFGYEGNPSGNWKKDALSVEQFKRNGWKPVAEMRSGNGSVHTVLRKHCVSGQTYRLRCNKYHPPIVILLPQHAAVSLLDENISNK